MELLSFCFPTAEIIGTRDRVQFACLPTELSLQSQGRWTLSMVGKNKEISVLKRVETGTCKMVQQLGVQGAGP